MKIGFVGLGVMGYPMAGHLQQAGFQVTVYNRTVERARAWQAQYAGETSPTPALAAYDAEIVCVCVGNDDDVRSVLYGEAGVFSALSEGALLVDHTTASADLARELYAHAAERSIGFIDAPVSGGQMGAENGALTVMAGGDAEDFARAKSILEVYAKCVRLLGPAGAGQLTKMVNQICIAGVVQSLAEGLTFAEQAGLDRSAVIDVIAKGAAQSWQMDHRYETMIQGHYEHGFAVDWMRKDLAMVLAEAQRCNVELPVTALVDGFYSEVQAMDGGRWDTSSLYARMQNQKPAAQVANDEN